VSAFIPESEELAIGDRWVYGWRYGSGIFPGVADKIGAAAACRHYAGTRQWAKILCKVVGLPLLEKLLLNRLEVMDGGSTRFSLCMVTRWENGRTVPVVPVGRVEFKGYDRTDEMVEEFDRLFE
jgi:hypothetical protein